MIFKYLHLNYSEIKLNSENSFNKTIVTLSTSLPDHLREPTLSSDRFRQNYLKREVFVSY